MELPSSLDDFAEHLRAVNLTLTVISIGLVLAAVFGRSYEIDRAIDDIGQITEAVQTWDDDWLREYVDEKVSEAGARGESEKLVPIQIKLGDSQGVFVDICGSDWALPKPDLLIAFRFEPSKVVPLVDFPPYQVGPDDARKMARRYTDLALFRSYWTGLNEAVEVRVPETLAEKALLQPANGEKWEVVDWSSVEKRAPFGGVLDIRDFTCDNPSAIKAIESSFAQGDPLHNSRCAYEGSLSEAEETRRPRARGLHYCRKIEVPAKVNLDAIGRVILPVSYYRGLPIRPQQDLREHLASKNLVVKWRFGSFEYSFPD